MAVRSSSMLPLRGVCFLLLLSLPFQLNGESQPGQKFLVPFMWHGPNNQVNAIKETLTLASLLRRTVAIPDLQQHLFSDANKDPMHFDALFDVPHLKESANAVLLAELMPKMADQDRTLDAVLIVGNDKEKGNVARLAEGVGLRAPRKRLWLDSPVSSSTGCHPEQIAELKALLEPYDVVGVQSFHGLFVGSQALAGPLGWECGHNSCCEGFRKATMAVRKAPQIMDAAADFIRRRIGEGQPFVAAHVRPYPDPCLKVWTMPSGSNRTAAMQQECNNEYLYDRFAPSIKALMRTYNTDKAFVMTHPKMRSVVLSKLREHGVEPIFMDLEEALPLMRKLAARSTLAVNGGAQLSSSSTSTSNAAPSSASAAVSVSVLAMLEEAVCAHATAFVGTKESSMSGTIVQERISAGISLNHTYSFFRWTGFEEKPVQLTQFYEMKATARGVQQNARPHVPVGHGAKKADV